LWEAAANAHNQPAAARRSFLIRRTVMLIDLPDARVTGADPAYALSVRASANRVRSSPISARIRAPAESLRPGKLVMISWSGCWPNASAVPSAGESALRHVTADSLKFPAAQTGIRGVQPLVLA
jgi:hypothetical protein